MHLKHWEQDGKKLKSQARPKYKKRILKRLKIAMQRIKKQMFKHSTNHSLSLKNNVIQIYLIKL
jgi:hypothetical protein